MRQHYIFGYGSLVNRATHDYARAHPATLRGWRREWRATTLREVAFLNVVPAPGSAIHGMMLGVAPDDPALQAREYAYARRAVSDAVTHDRDAPAEVSVFAIAPDAHGAQHARCTRSCSAMWMWWCRAITANLALPGSRIFSRPPTAGRRR